MNSSSCRFDPRPPNSHNCLESRLQEAGLAKGRRYGSSQNTRKVERLSGRSPNDAVGNRRKLRKQRYDGWRSVLERGRNHSPFSESAGPAATNVCPRCNTQLSSWPPVELHSYGLKPGLRAEMIGDCQPLLSSFALDPEVHVPKITWSLGESSSQRLKLRAESNPFQ
jgi:hypothetical protein